MNFNNKQEEAINSTSNVTVVVAGAGSGKTAVLTERIKKLLNQGVNSYNILAITFTNKAANEMKERVLERSGIEGSGVFIMTFHALALKIIRENVDHLKNYQSNFLIIDDDDKKRIIKNIIKDLNLEEEIKVQEVLHSIGYAKSRALTYNNVKNLIYPNLLSIYLQYREYLHQNNAMDFDDLLLLCYELLKIEEVKERYQNLFKYISVDEFQDTSLLQGEILKKLKNKDNNLFIVGDIDQSIYTWRGAMVENLLEISQEYEDVKTIKLEQNYRSGKNILEAANKLIQNNKKRIEKNLWTENKSGLKISHYQVQTNSEEAKTVIREINSLADYGSSYDDFAVLYRYNYQSRKIEEALLKNKIPYIIYGGIRFYQRLEIKDILAYIRLFINPHDNISLLRIINVPKRKVGEKTLEKIREISFVNQISIFEALEQSQQKNLDKLIYIIKKYSYLVQEGIDNDTFYKGFDLFLEELQYEEYLLTQYDKFNVEDRMKNIKELKESILQEIDAGGDLKNYINEISLYDVEEDNLTDKVVLSTIHGVKGLEFNTVFMIGMIEGKFPKEAAFHIEDELEEERRLAYVGITRAKERLIVINHLYDFKYEHQKPSRFLEEMGIEILGDDLENFIF